MTLTLWVVLVAMGSLLFIGLPFTKILYGSQQVDEFLWTKAPFIGLAVIVLVLQNLVYLDLPVGLTTPVIWVIALLLWGGLIFKKKVGQLFAVFPFGLYRMTLVVFALHSVGLFLVGARYYVGRAWIDQWNYVAIAQFLTDYVYSLSLRGIDHAPYLAKAITLKDDRIGQSIFHGFLATSTFTDAKTTFEPAILLTPFLITLAVYHLAKKFAWPKKQALIAGLLAGVIPGVTFVHLESFFSQALTIPLLIMWPVWVEETLEEWRWPNLITGALLLALATTTYTEFYIIFLGVALIIVVVKVIYRRENAGRYLLAAGGMVGLALLLNLGFRNGIINVFQRISTQNVLSHIYPWAYQPEGLAHLWFGEFFTELPPFGQVLLPGLAVLLTLAAYGGVIIMAAYHKNSLSAAVLAVVSLPVLVRLRGDEYSYQFYKILLSTSPFLAVGLVSLVIIKPLLRNRAWLDSKMIWISRVGLSLVILLAAWGTLDMVQRSADPNARRRLGAHNYELLTPEIRELQDRLTAMTSQKLLIVNPSPIINGWLAYFARHNLVWLDSTLISDINLADYPETAGMISPENLPEDAYILSQNFITNEFIPRPNWQVGNYMLCNIKKMEQEWLLVTNFSNPNGVEVWDGQPAFWLGTEPTTIDILSGKSGTITISGNFVVGPSLPEKLDRDILIQTNHGYKQELKLAGGKNHLMVPIQSGATRIVLQPLDIPSVAALPSGDTRPLLLGIVGAAITDFK